MIVEVAMWLIGGTLYLSIGAILAVCIGVGWEQGQDDKGAFVVFWLVSPILLSMVLMYVVGAVKLFQTIIG